MARRRKQGRIRTQFRDLWCHSGRHTASALSLRRINILAINALSLLIPSCILFYPPSRLLWPLLILIIGRGWISKWQCAENRVPKWNNCSLNEHSFRFGYLPRLNLSMAMRSTLNFIRGQLVHKQFYRRLEESRTDGQKSWWCCPNCWTQGSKTVVPKPMGGITPSFISLKFELASSLHTWRPVKPLEMTRCHSRLLQLSLLLTGAITSAAVGSRGRLNNQRDGEKAMPAPSHRHSYRGQC